MRVQALFFLSAFACVATLQPGCRRQRERDDDRHDDATRTANERAERIAQDTTITGGELTRTEAGADTMDDALRTEAAALAAFRREQSDAKGVVQEEIDRIDEQLATLRQVVTEQRGGSRKDAARAHTLAGRRELLRKDMDAIDRATETDWPALRHRIARDVAPTPSAEPRSERP
jgi:hypothetical protein